MRLLIELVRTPMITIWRLQGWDLANPLPETPQYIIVAVPHTTMWDYWHMLCAAAKSRRRPNVTMKKELFFFPLNLFVSALGAIPIDRQKRSNMIEAMANLFKENPRMILVFTPEGSRKYTDHWRSGFYYTALQANVPIVFGYIDYTAKRIGATLIMHPTGDLEADFEQVKAYYDVHGRNGLYPEYVSRLALKPVDQA